MKTIIIYRVISRTARATQNNLVSKQNKTITKTFSIDDYLNFLANDLKMETPV